MMLSAYVGALVAIGRQYNGIVSSLFTHAM